MEADPREVLVATGLASRRAWLGHFRLCPYLAASPEGDDFTRDALGAMAVLFERLELEGDEAAAAFYAYGTFMLGSILFALSPSRSPTPARTRSSSSAPSAAWSKASAASRLIPRTPPSGEDEDRDLRVLGADAERRLQPVVGLAGRCGCR